MPLRLKQSIEELGGVRRALRRRVSDEENRQLTEKEIDARSKVYLQNNAIQTSPPIVAGNPLFSFQFNEFLKDTKFNIGSLNGRIGNLEADIRSTTKESFGILNDIQQEAQGLDSFVTEEEIKVLRNFTKVHFNSFVRAIDADLNFRNRDWLVDYKTDLPFLKDNQAYIIPGTGITLPVRERVNVPIADIELVGEETDVGDTKKPILSNDPRNLLFKNHTFRHVIVRTEFDRTTRRYNKTPSYCTFLLTLANNQLINYLGIKPVGQSTVEVAELSYINEAGEEVVLTTSSFTAEVNVIVLFEPIRTKYLKVRFQQFAPVSKTAYNVKDWRVKELNEILRGVGFTQLLNEPEQSIQGRVFDFSMEELRVGLLIYQSLGVFRSRPVKVKRPMGLDISDRAETIDISREQGPYGPELFLPPGAVLNEYYVGATLKDKNGNTALRDLIPVPDNYPVQLEYLPLIGGESRAKLFPDMLWNLDTIRVVRAELISFFPIDAVWQVTTEIPHGLVVGSTFVAKSYIDHNFNGESTVSEVIDDFTFTTVFGPTAVGDDTTTIDENTFPRALIYTLDNQEDPLSVNMETETLSIGTDYEVSIDAGATWHSSFPRGDDYLEALRDARSGNFRIRFLNPRYDRIYFIEYRPLKNQFLGKTDLVRLKNGRVIFDRSLRETKGTLNTVVVSRSGTFIPLISPVILFYILKVREFVS